MTRWIFEPGHTAAWFRARHMMVTHVRGGFTGIRGEVDFDPGDPARGSVTAEIDARTLWTGEKARDEHLKSEDFLHVAAHPKIRFRGDRVEPLSCNELRVLGELTLRGVTFRHSSPHIVDRHRLTVVGSLGYERGTRHVLPYSLAEGVKDRPHSADGRCPWALRGNRNNFRGARRASGARNCAAAGGGRAGIA